MHSLLDAFLAAGMVLGNDALRIGLVAPPALRVPGAAATPNLAPPAAQTSSLLRGSRIAGSFSRLRALIHPICSGRAFRGRRGYDPQPVPIRIGRTGTAVAVNYRQQVNAQGRIYSLLRKYLSWNDGGLLNVRRIGMAETVSAGTDMGDVE